VIGDTLKPSTYFKRMPICQRDVVLDLGMHIGTFSVYAGRWARMVIGVEPDPENYRLAEMNLEENRVTNVRLYRAAVVGDDRERADFWLNRKRGKDGHSLIRKQGRERIEVECVNISDLISKHKPTKIKMDIEGAEVEVLRAADLSGVDHIVIEYHRIFLGDRMDNQPFDEIQDRLAEQFDWVRATRPKGFHSMIYAGRGRIL
jgi:FkbM family methyltransferase